MGTMKIANTGGVSADIMAMRQAILEKNVALREAGTNGSAQALSPALGRVSSPTVAAPADASAPMPFANVLQQSLQAVSGMQAESGTQMAAYERGEQTDIAAVMLARQKASVAFEATMQVRNKLLSAYSDIMNMPL